MLTEALLDLDWAARRRLGRGLRRDRIDPDGADPEAPASFETCVIPLPGVLAERLHDVAASIAAVQPAQYVCSAETLHVTVCGPVHLPDGKAVERALEDIRSVASSLQGGRLRAVRLGVGDTSIFAAFEAVDGDLLAVRRALAERWAVPRPRGPGGLIARRLLWANLVRFSEPPSAALLDALAPVRRVNHSGVTIGAMDLVRTNRVMAPARTSLLGRVEVRP